MFNDGGKEAGRRRQIIEIVSLRVVTFIYLAQQFFELLICVGIRKFSRHIVETFFGFLPSGRIHRGGGKLCEITSHFEAKVAAA